MSVFQSLVKKEALHLLRDFRTIIVVLVMPVVLLLLFGFAISTEVNNVRVATVVEQHTDQTKQIIDRFRANPYFTFEGVVAYSDVEDLLREGKLTPLSCSALGTGSWNTRLSWTLPIPSWRRQPRLIWKVSSVQERTRR